MGLIPNSFVEKSWRDALSKLAAGTLEFIAPNGEVTIAQGAAPGPKAQFKLKEWDVLRRTMARGDIALGEDYIAGSWETDDIERLISVFLLNMEEFDSFANGSPLHRMGLVLHNKLIRRNSLSGSRRNIQDHYDVGNDFYKLWLDRSMTYSSAVYGSSPDVDLEQAQQRKYGRILEHFSKPKSDVLEIGCGWGGFAERASADGHHVTGLTISPSQFRFATERLRDKAEIKFEDYRKSKGLFDMVVSIEMFEAVGEQYWPRYFRTVADRLKRGGRAMIQTIAIRDELFTRYRVQSDFVRHYVFPGGMLPSLARFREEAERAGLKVAGVYTFGKDYARTLREWSRRMRERKDEVVALGYDEKFFRNWQFYLGICAATFNVSRTDVAQIELVNA